MQEIASLKKRILIGVALAVVVPIAAAGRFFTVTPGQTERSQNAVERFRTSIRLNESERATIASPDVRV